MAERKKPTGYVARCQCGEPVGAIDLERCERDLVNRVFGRWISEGMTLEPRFTSNWRCEVIACGCKAVRHG